VDAGISRREHQPQRHKECGAGKQSVPPVRPGSIRQMRSFDFPRRQQRKQFLERVFLVCHSPLGDIRVQVYGPLQPLQGIVAVAEQPGSQRKQRQDQQQAAITSSRSQCAWRCHHWRRRRGRSNRARDGRRRRAGRIVARLLRREVISFFVRGYRHGHPERLLATRTPHRLARQRVGTLEQSVAAQTADLDRHGITAPPFPRAAEVRWATGRCQF